MGLAAQLEQPDLPVPLHRAIAVVCPDNGIALNRRSIGGRPVATGNRNFLAARYIVGVEVILPLKPSPPTLRPLLPHQAGEPEIRRP